MVRKHFIGTADFCVAERETLHNPGKNATVKQMPAEDGCLCFQHLGITRISETKLLWKPRVCVGLRRRWPIGVPGEREMESTSYTGIRQERDEQQFSLPVL